jgi:hypothetical protein
MIPLLGQWALQLVENQLAMLLEYAQRRFERMEHRLSNLQGVANIQRVLEDYALASDVGLHVGNVTVGLGKMAANYRSKDTGIPETPPRKVYLGEAQLWRGQAPSEVRACPLRQLQKTIGFVSTARAACPRSASAAVIAVTDYSSNSPLFFGRPICASRSRLGLSWS